MLRKTCFLVALSLFSGPSFPSLYLGAAIGPEGARFSQYVHFVQTVNVFNNVYDKNNFAGTGVFGSLFAGFGRAFNCWYLAAEINANLSSVRYEAVNDEFVFLNFQKTSFTIRNSVGFSLLPGYFLSQNTLLYGRLAYVNGRIKLNESDTTINSFNGNRSGFRYGLGLRHCLSSQWALMMDYSQTQYQGINSFYSEPQNGLTKDTKTVPYSAQLAFGLIYNFDVAQVEEDVQKD